ncbi:MAG TPA: hypothetical protein VGG75_06125 [Trebonia sp.]|jgi:hypothetical protein
MPGPAWLTLIAAAIIIVFAAIGLFRVIYHLAAVRDTLGQVIGGVNAVADLTSPVPARLTSVNENLKPVRDFCETV